MEKLTVFVYRSIGGDCTMEGITSKHDMLTLVRDYTDEDLDELRQSEEAHKILLLEKRELFNKPLWLCIPLIEKPNCHRMMGGNYVVTSDSRYKDFTPFKLGFPLPVHDRYETQKQYNEMCR